MFCTNCGTKNNEGVAFCTNCGNRVKQAGVGAAPAAPSPPPSAQQPQQGAYQTGQQPHGGGPPPYQPPSYQQPPYQPAPYNPGMPINTPGKIFLLVTGIICIVGASISIITSIVGLATFSPIMALIGLGGLRAVYVFSLLGGIYQLVLGISGVRFCNILAKGELLYRMGIAALLLPLISLIISLAIGGGIGFIAILGFVLPILFIIGAKMNKDAAR